MNTKKEHAKIDWMITLVPLAIVIALCVLFFLAPEQSNAVLSQIRFFLDDTFGTYYLVIGSASDRDGKYSGLGRRISTVPLELHSVGILSGTGCCLWLYAPCKKKKPSEIFRGLPSDSWKAYRWLGRSHY